MVFCQNSHCITAREKKTSFHFLLHEKIWHYYSTLKIMTWKVDLNTYYFSRFTQKNKRRQINFFLVKISVYYKTNLLFPYCCSNNRKNSAIIIIGMRNDDCTIIFKGWNRRFLRRKKSLLPRSYSGLLHLEKIEKTVQPPQTYLHFFANFKALCIL